MEYKIIATSNGEFKLPKSVCETLGIQSGSEISVKLRDDKVIELKLTRGSLDEVQMNPKAENAINNQTDNPASEAFLVSTFL